MLTTARGDVLTLGAVFAVYFASSGVESLRIGLNRAYGLREPRRWWLLRLESIGYVLVSAFALAGAGVSGRARPAGVPAPRSATRRGSSRLRPITTIARFGIGGLVLALALFILHMWLPAGRRRLGEVWPGILATLLLWLACGFVFGRYLADFSYAYVTYYAGLASAMTALVFLYFSAWIFIYGGELNAAIARAREGLRNPVIARSNNGLMNIHSVIAGLDPAIHAPRAPCADRAVCCAAPPHGPPGQARR